MDTREYVEYLLENYHSIRREIAHLRFELQYFKDITPDETLEMLTFSKSVGETVQNSMVSDKTAKIALVYREINKRQNWRAKSEIAVAIRQCEHALDKLDNCIACLPEKFARVVKGIYIDEKTWPQICSEQFIAQRTVSNYRKKAIEEIASIFDSKRIIAD